MPRKAQLHHILRVLPLACAISMACSVVSYGCSDESATSPRQHSPDGEDGSEDQEGTGSTQTGDGRDGQNQDMQGGHTSDASPGLSFRVMTFNCGTTDGLDHDRGEDEGQGDGYTSEMARITDEFYENSLSWNPAEAALTSFLSMKQVDIVVFQEMYFDPWCETIEVDPQLDFVCRDYTPQRPLQVERLLGAGYQVACADGQEDNCIAVSSDFASLRGCPANAPCIGGLEGMGPPSGCSNGARISRIELDLVDDDRDIVVVNVHGTSGINPEDQDCRADQFSQIFEDRGDGTPAANGDVNLVMGDLNTDPFLVGDAEPSSAMWNRFVGPAKPFDYISSSDLDGPPTYAGLFRIDHVASDAIRGECVVAGEHGESPIWNTVYWDHNPVICDVFLPDE